MLLVPRQLQRVGMTGDVPYYGPIHSAQTHAAFASEAPPSPEVREGVERGRGGETAACSRKRSTRCLGALGGGSVDNYG
jgi:hypothetical protein